MRYYNSLCLSLVMEFINMYACEIYRAVKTNCNAN